jgi:hypothetical protein
MNTWRLVGDPSACSVVVPICIVLSQRNPSRVDAQHCINFTTQQRTEQPLKCPAARVAEDLAVSVHHCSTGISTSLNPLRIEVIDDGGSARLDSPMVQIFHAVREWSPL